MRMLTVFPERADLAMDGFARLSGVDVQVDAHEVTVRLVVPEVREEEVKINLSDDNILQVQAERHVHRQGTRGAWTIREARGSRFVRAVRLPEPVTVDGSYAAIHDGVLTIRLPRTNAIGKTTKTVKNLPREVSRAGRRWWRKLRRVLRTS